MAEGNTVYKSVDGNLYSYDGTTLIQYATGKTDDSFTIPDGVIYIDRAFMNARYLTSITIPDSVTSIGDYAFSGCRSLESITIPDSVTSIGVFAFYGCSSLTYVTIGSGVTCIGDYAFWLCSSLTSVEFKNTDGWTIGLDENSTDICVTDAEKNAVYLTDTYLNYAWYRN